MSSTITVRGFAATQPKITIVGDRLAIASFRVGATDRRFNRATGQWENGATSWYSVSCFRSLAHNAYASINKGDPVIVTGRLKVSEWSAGDKHGLDVEIEAEGVGHDFRWGKAAGFARTTPRSTGGKDDGAPVVDSEQAPPDEGADDSGFVPAPRSADADGWANPALAIASATTADAGEPAPLGFVGVDERTGELVDSAEAIDLGF